MKSAQANDLIRQGDVLLIPCSAPPESAIQPDRIGISIAGERTGHAHRLVGTVALVGRRELVRGGNVLSHEEHEHILTSPRWYEVRVQREHVPARGPAARWD